MAKKLNAESIDITRRVGIKVREARVRAGLSQERLAEGLGITFQQVQKYEKGANRIAVATLHRIATVIGVPAASLLDGDVAAATDAPPSLFTSANVRLLKTFESIPDPRQRARLISLIETMAPAGAETTEARAA